MLERMAFDRRTYDVDGHLRVADSVLTAVGVSKYYGSEVVDWQRLGLQSGGIYSLFRPPDELRRAAPGLAGKPILLSHQPISAAEHPRGLVVGAIGSDVSFDGATVRASLTLWGSKPKHAEFLEAFIFNDLW